MEKWILILHRVDQFLPSMLGPFNSHDEAYDFMVDYLGRNGINVAHYKTRYIEKLISPEAA